MRRMGNHDVSLLVVQNYLADRQMATDDNSNIDDYIVALNDNTEYETEWSNFLSKFQPNFHALVA